MSTFCGRSSVLVKSRVAAADHAEVAFEVLDVDCVEADDGLGCEG